MRSQPSKFPPRLWFQHGDGDLYDDYSDDGDDGEDEVEDEDESDNDKEDDAKKQATEHILAPTANHSFWMFVIIALPKHAKTDSESR